MIFTVSISPYCMIIQYKGELVRKITSKRDTCTLPFDRYVAGYLRTRPAIVGTSPPHEGCSNSVGVVNPLNFLVVRVKVEALEHGRLMS